MDWWRPRLKFIGILREQETGLSKDLQIEWQHIAPSKPQQNGHVGSFNVRVREERLNEALFALLSHARVVLSNRRDDYNHVQPHIAS